MPWPPRGSVQALGVLEKKDSPGARMLRLGVTLGCALIVACYAAPASTDSELGVARVRDLLSEPGAIAALIRAHPWAQGNDAPPRCVGLWAGRTPARFLERVTPHISILRDLPSAALAELRRLDQGYYPVSRCRQDTAGYSLREAPRSAAALWLRSPERLDDSTGRAEIGFRHAYNAAGYLCLVHRRQTGWIVEEASCSELWVS